MSASELQEFIYMIKYLSFALLVLFCGCTIDKDKTVERDKFSFKTADDTEIFFRNMSASSYDKEERKDTNWEIYRHEDLYNDTSGYAINAAIVVNVLNDQAYLLIEPGEKLQELDKIIVFASDPQSSDDENISLDVPNKETMLEFASQLYEAIRDGKNLKLRVGDNILPLFEDPDRRQAFRRTMADYYRLTRIF